MQEITTESLYLLGIIIVSIVSLLSLVMIANQRRQFEKVQQEHHQSEQNHTAQLNVLLERIQYQDQQLTVFQKRLKQTVDRQYELANNQGDKPDKAEVVRLISMGASIDDLVNNCGMARGEAELMIAMGTGFGKSA